MQLFPPCTDLFQYTQLERSLKYVRGTSGLPGDQNGLIHCQNDIDLVFHCPVPEKGISFSLISFFFKVTTSQAMLVET